MPKKLTTSDPQYPTLWSCDVCGSLFVTASGYRACMGTHTSQPKRGSGSRDGDDSDNNRPEEVLVICDGCRDLGIC